MAVIAVIKESRDGETRVAATPETVRKLAASGFTVQVESGAGAAAAFLDGDYQGAGATLVSDPVQVLSAADVLLKVRAPSEPETAALKRGAIVVGLLNPFLDKPAVTALAAAGATAFAMEFTPRTTRAQVMDALSSQANLAGYRAMIEASAAYGRAMPMMMTAAGTVAPAKVFVMGAGVAGLQAVAKIGRAHVCTPVTSGSRMPSSA